MIVSDEMGFALGINLKDYRDVRKSSRARKTLGPDPYAQAYVTMMICLASDFQEQLPHRVNLETIAYLCDEDQRSVNVKAVYDKLKENNPTCAPWMGSLSYMDNERSPALQAADLLAGQCKQFLIESIENPRKESPESLIARWKPILGRNVGIRCLDKRSLKLCVDANVPRKGKLSIYSTQQSSLFKDLIVAGKKQ